MARTEAVILADGNDCANIGAQGLTMSVPTTGGSAMDKSAELDGRHAPEKKLARWLLDALYLADYAVENDSLPEDVVVGDLYRMQKEFAGHGWLNKADVDMLARYYASLQRRLAPVTAVSLAATECQGVADCMKTEAGMHARRMWTAAFVVVTLIATLNLGQYVYEFNASAWAPVWPDGMAVASALYMLAVYAAPFLYGALGACVHILRATERHLRLRTFDPRRIPQHRNRLVLGTLSGGTIVLFVTADGGSDASLKLTAAAAGFLAGYSIDFLFAILDRILSAVVPPGDSQQRDTATVSKTKETKAGSTPESAGKEALPEIPRQSIEPPARARAVATALPPGGLHGQQAEKVLEGLHGD